MMDRCRRWIRPSPPGYKYHLSIDRRFRPIRRWKATGASAHDGARLREGLPDRGNTGSAVWAASACRSGANEGFMERHGFVPNVHHKKPPPRETTIRTGRSSAGKSVIRSRIGHVCADRNPVQSRALSPSACPRSGDRPLLAVRSGRVSPRHRSVTRACHAGRVAGTRIRSAWPIAGYPAPSRPARRSRCRHCRRPARGSRC